MVKLLIVLLLQDNDEIILVSDKGQIIRVNVNQIRIAGRSTKGVSIFKILKVIELFLFLEYKNLKMMNKIGIYPGHFDPMTAGHMDIIKRSLRIVDNLVIAVANNINKDSLFSVQERINIIKSDISSVNELNSKINVMNYQDYLQLLLKIKMPHV